MDAYPATDEHLICNHDDSYQTACPECGCAHPFCPDCGGWAPTEPEPTCSIKGCPCHDD